MAASTVSRLESGARRLALDHLPPLARALGVSVDALLAPQERADPRVRSRVFTRHGLTFLPLTRAGAASGMHAYKVYYPPAERVPTPTVHDGHDWIYVLAGRLRLVSATRTSYCSSARPPSSPAACRTRSPPSTAQPRHWRSSAPKASGYTRDDAEAKS